MISHRFKCVFVHIPKTAGQSVELAFLNAMGLGWNDRAPLLLRPCSDDTIGPQRLAHMFAHEYVSLGHMFEADFNAYYKFSIVRDPISRVKSSYLFKTGGEGISLKDFVVEARSKDKNSPLYRQLAPQSEYLCDQEGNLLVDEVGRFETFASDATRMLANCGLEVSEMPFRNKTKTSAEDKDIGLDDECRAWLYDIYREDYERFGYER